MRRATGMHLAGRPSFSSTSSSRATLRRRARSVAVLLLAVLEPLASARAELPRVREETGVRACEYCAPGTPPPPPHVQEQVRRLNEQANWRRHRSRAADGSIIPLGAQTRSVLRQAWASGRLQPGAVAVGGGSGVPAARQARRAAAGQRRLTLGDRSRNSLRGDRRGSRADRRARREQERASNTSSLGRSGLGRSRGTSRGSDRTGTSFGSGSGFGTSSSFGRSGSGSGFGSEGGLGSDGVE